MARDWRGAQVIFGTDAHIARSPDFGSQLAGWAGAARVLTLVDEINFLATGFRRRVARADLVRFARVLGEVDSGRWGAFHGDWCWRSGLLLRAPSADLRHPDWRMPTFPIDWAVEVQARGWEAHDTRFRFLGHDLQQFGRSPLESRERHANGDLSFAAPPAVRGDFALFSGTAVPEFVRFRLGRDLACPFAGYRFGHPGTTLVQHREQARDACPFPRQRRSNPGLLRESGQPPTRRGATAPADRQETVRRPLLPPGCGGGWGNTTPRRSRS